MMRMSIDCRVKRVFGFVEMPNKEEAEKAIAGLNSTARTSRAVP
jgi:hypothetical protein